MLDVICFDKEVKKAKNLDEASGNLWIDVKDITKQEQALLQKEFGLHPLTAEDLFNKNTRIKVEEFNNYLFCVFYGIRKAKKIEMMEVDFILGKDFLITNHKGSIDFFEELKKDKERLDKLFNKGVDFLFHKLLDLEVDNYFPVLEDIDEKIEKIEEEVTKRARTESLNKILKLKQQIVAVKRYALPQREKISFLAKNDYKFISKKAIPYFRDIYDHMIRVADNVDNYREYIGNTFDAYMSAVSNSMNEVMKTLSIIATIALPLTVISGIYGTNFTVLPGQNMIYGFWIMLFIMVLVALGMMYHFKRKNWF